MSLVDRTHGRWPWVAAGAAAPATALVLARRDWLAQDLRWALWGPLPVLLWHQTEEWVWPGGFLPWMNREVIGSDDDEQPITRRGGLAINAGVGWALTVVGATRGVHRPGMGAAVLSMLAGNAALHLGEAARHRRYNPGTATSALALAPLGVAGLVALARDPRAPRRPVALGAVGGVLASAGLMAGMRRRVRRRPVETGGA